MKNNLKKIYLILGLIMTIVIPFVLMSFTNIIDHTAWGGWVILLIFFTGCAFTYLTIRKDQIENLSVIDINARKISYAEKMGSYLFGISKGLVVMGIILTISAVALPYAMLGVVSILYFLIAIGLIEIICSFIIKKSDNRKLKMGLLLSNIAILIISSLLIYIITK